MNPLFPRALACVALLAASAMAPARATTFSFAAAAPTNAATPLTIAAGGLTASFTSPSGAGAFIAEDGSAFSTLGNAALADDNFTPEELDVSFSGTVSSIVFNYATNDGSAPTAVTLTATRAGLRVGSVTTTGVVAASGLPEGVLSFTGGPFDAVQVTDASPANFGFAIGAVTVQVPEPSTLAALAMGLIGLVAMRRRA